MRMKSPCQHTWPAHPIMGPTHACNEKGNPHTQQHREARCAKMGQSAHDVACIADPSYDWSGSAFATGSRTVRIAVHNWKGGPGNVSNGRLRRHCLV